MKRIKLSISYDGTDYHGWQVQPNGITVQQTLQDSLEKLFGYRPSVTGCSRTDAGVHACEFVCHLDCDEVFPGNAFLKGLNSLLPNDISVIDYSEVNSEFHARYDSKGKTYIYSMYSGAINPFKSRYMLHIENKPDIDLMNEFCSNVIGTHDFAGFSSSKRTVENTVRTVSECTVFTKENNIHFKITADGFLYNMVRIMVGTLLFVSEGKIKSGELSNIISSKERKRAGKTAPPQGLYLNKVNY